MTNKFHRPCHNVVILLRTDFNVDCDGCDDPESTKIVNVFWTGHIDHSIREFVDFWLQSHPIHLYSSWFGDIYPKFRALPFKATNAEPE